MWKEVDDYIFEWETREHVLRQFWQSFVDDRFDLDIAIQTKAEFFYATVVMDKIGGLEKDWVGSRFAAGMWTFSKAVIRNGQNNMQNYRLLQFRSITEAVNWVCDDALDDHVWVSELTISCQEAKVLEALQYDFTHPCIVQWGLLWFSAPTNFNSGIFINEVILGQFGFSECLHSALLDDENPKILFLEVDTYCIVQIT